MPKKKSVRTRVCTVTCGKCGDEIFSRARHDFRSCKCGKTFIDGGFDYVKGGFDPDVGFSQGVRYVNATRAELYQDWNTQKDKFGKIRPSEKDK
jgi:ribosomal protein S27E